MNRMFFNSQCSIFPDEYAIGKIVELDRKIEHFQRDMYAVYFV